MLYIDVCVCACVSLLHLRCTRSTTLKTFDLLCAHFKQTCVCDPAQARASARTLMQMHPDAAAVDAGVAVTLPHPEKTAFFYKSFWIFRFSFLHFVFAVLSAFILLFAYVQQIFTCYSL